jgi:hypothetical protein
MVEKSDKRFLNSEGWNTYGIYLTFIILTGLILFFDFQIPLGVAIDVLYIIVVWISFWSSRKSFTIIVAVVCSVLTIGSAFFQPIVPEMWKVVFNRCLALFAIWITTLLGLQRKLSEEKREKALREREKALEETRILRGLLPICASCKKIRDDQGYWTQMEGYIRDHSEADFSHGICPECAKKLYPEIYK